MMETPLSEYEKTIIFEVYSAGYVDGFNGTNDIATSFEKWLSGLYKDCKGDANGR